MLRSPRRVVAPFLAALAFAACGGGEPGELGKREHRRVVLSVDVEGLSGLTADDSGRLHAIPERDRAILTIEDGTARRTSLEGVPDGIDTEAIAWLGGSRFAIGTESREVRRTHDAVLIVEEGRVVETIDVPYEALGVRPEDNHGIEGICVAGDTLLVAVERVVEQGGRLAVLGRRPLAGGSWSSGRVRLTSAIGKLSALSCRAEGDRVIVHAVERGLHDGAWVGRIVRFEAPRSAEPVDAEVVADLAAITSDRPNPEGLVVRGGRAAVVIDNHYRVRTGPNELLWIGRLR